MTTHENMSDTTTYNRWTKVWFCTALITSWLTFIFFFTIPFGILFWLIALTVLFIRKSKLKWYLIAFSAWTVIPVYSFYSGSKDYFKGKATLQSIGLPSVEFYNLDRQYRAWNSSSGCIVLGFEPLTQLPNNIAVKFWTNFLGFQKTVYQGIYPDEIKTAKLIDSVGRETNFSMSNMAFKFRLDTKDFHINETEHRDMQNLDSSKTARVALINNELIIFKPKVSSDELVTYLADSRTGEIFARYYEYKTNGTNR